MSLLKHRKWYQLWCKICYTRYTDINKLSLTNNLYASRKTLLIWCYQRTVINSCSFQGGSKVFSIFSFPKPNSLVLRQKGESQSRYFKKTKHAEFSKKRLWGVMKWSFSGKFSMLCFLEIPVLRFALLPLIYQ